MREQLRLELYFLAIVIGVIVWAGFFLKELRDLRSVMVERQLKEGKIAEENERYWKELQAAIDDARRRRAEPIYTNSDFAR